MSKLTNVAKIMGAGVYATQLEDACRRWGVVGDVAQAHFLAQMSVESKGFTDLTEDSNYRPERVVEMFGGRNGKNRTVAEARQTLAQGREAFFESIYGIPWGIKKLGNIKPGDGGKYWGRGLKQLTGRDNYTRYSIAQYGDYRALDNPDMLLQPFDACMSAAWYFKTSKAYNAALGDNVKLCTLRVNGGYNALDRRHTLTQQAKREFAKLA